MTVKENPFLSSETGYIILSSEKSPRGIFIIRVTYYTLRRLFKLKTHSLERHRTWRKGLIRLLQKLSVLELLHRLFFLKYRIFCLMALTNFSSQIPNNLEIPYVSFAKMNCLKWDIILNFFCFEGLKYTHPIPLTLNLSAIWNVL